MKKNGQYKSIVGILLSFCFIPIGFIVSLTNLTTPQKVVFECFIIWLNTGLLFVYAYRVERRNFLIWPEISYKLFFYFISICILYVLIDFCWIISPLLVSWYHDSSKLDYNNGIAGTLNKPAFYLLAITGDVTEELIFRGYLITRLKLLFRKNSIAIVISSLGFSVYHAGFHSL